MLLGSFELMLGALAAAQAGAADEPPQPPDNREIVVTGERAKRSLKDTASSVVVITGPEIDSLAQDRADQIFAAIANVQLGQGSEGLAIRGEDTTGVL